MSQNPNNRAGDSNRTDDSDSDDFDSQFCSWLTNVKTNVRPARSVRKASASVISAVSKSVNHSVREPRPPAWVERSYRLDPTVPTTWDAHEVQSGTFIAYKFPQSIKDVEDDVPLERCRPEIARIQMAPEPFARGSERLAYYGRDLQTEEDVVLKEYIRVYSDEDEAHRHDCANQLQTVASYFAGLFMADCEEKMPAGKIPASLDFLKVKTLALDTTEEPRYMNCEPRLDSAATFVRFTNNCSHVMSEEKAQSEGVSVDVLRFVVAFSHYTYTVTKGKLMIVDLQGTIKSKEDGGRPTVLLTDPAIHCDDRTRFGSTNYLKRGMYLFFYKHACNEFCVALKLPKVDTEKLLDQ